MNKTPLTIAILLFIVAIILLTLAFTVINNGAAKNATIAIGLVLVLIGCGGIAAELY